MTNADRSQLSLDLLPAVRAGDRAAEERFLALHMPLIQKEAARYAARIRPGGLEQGDLMQEGRIALLTAIRKFDPERGVRFGTYAVSWVRQSMGRCLANENHIVRIPVHIRNDLVEILSLDYEYEGQLGDPGEPSTFGDRVASDEEPIHRQAIRGLMVEDLLSVLEDRERLIVERWCVGYSLREIGDDLGLSRERVRQIREACFGKIRMRAREKWQSEFVEEPRVQWRRSGRAVW